MASEPLVAFHQCMDAEWDTWGRESALEFAEQGFAVIRVKSRPWQELKTEDPESFRTPYIEAQNRQQMICTIVMRDITCPMILEVVQQMRSGELPMDMRTWDREHWTLELPPGDGPCKPRLDVVAVTEASAQLAHEVDPQVFRAVYRSYPHRFVWAGFNARTRVTGSKLLLGAPGDFRLLIDVFQSLKVWHIDQQYKSFQDDYFTVVYGTPDILVGCRDHVSGCCDRHAASDRYVGHSFLPQPRLGEQRRVVTKVQLPDAARFIISSLHNFGRCRGPADDLDTVALRMWSYVREKEGEIGSFEPMIDEHRENQRKLAVEKAAKRVASAVLKAQANDRDAEDTETIMTVDHMLSTDTPLPEAAQESPVFQHINKHGLDVKRQFSEWVILGMCQRGLCLNERSVLSCCFHRQKQFHGLWHATQHFQNYGFHRHEQEQQRLEDYRGELEEPWADVEVISDSEDSSAQGVWALGQPLPPDAALPSLGADAALPSLGADAALPSLSLQPDAALPSPEADTALPLPTSTPIEIREINEFADALVFMQWLAHGTSGIYDPLPVQWPPFVRKLQAHCNHHAGDLVDLNSVVNEILQYGPCEWRGFQGCYIPELKTAMTKVWKAAFKSHGFISEDLAVQLKWYYELNQFAVKSSLLCKFVVQGVKTQTPCLAFQAQGRLATTR